MSAPNPKLWIANASPPCQGYANVTLWRGSQGDHPRLIQPMRERLVAICCCTCRYRARDYHHPDTTGGNICSQRGYVCLAPEFELFGEHVFSGWTEHGLCGMWNEAAPLVAMRTLLAAGGLA